MTRREFTPDEHRTITMLIADECPPGEIAATIGVSTSLITSRYPEARGTRQQLKEWQSVRAFQTKCEQTYDRRTDAPRLGQMIVLNPRTIPAKPGPKRELWTADRLARAEQLLADGLSYNAVARHLGCDRKTVQKRFPDHGHRKGNAA